MRALSPLVLPAMLAIPSPAERSPEQKQFDFWLGRWEVHDAKGQRLGHNTIVALLGGTVLQEHWEGAKGGAGTSLNAYVLGQKAWRQHWVDASGGVLDLEGGMKGGSMILLGVQEGPKGRTLERICWTPLPDGRVRQLWEQSLDGGATWVVSFDGYYSRARPEALRLP
jgi:hypothetical protein